MKHVMKEINLISNTIQVVNFTVRVVTLITREESSVIKVGVAYAYWVFKRRTGLCCKSTALLIM